MIVVVVVDQAVGMVRRAISGGLSRCSTTSSPLPLIITSPLAPIPLLLPPSLSLPLLLLLLLPPALSLPLVLLFLSSIGCEKRVKAPLSPYSSMDIE